MDGQSLDSRLGREIRSGIIKRNQLRGPLNSDAERMLDKLVGMELNDRYDADARNIRNSIIRENQLSGPLSYDAERMLDKLTEIELEERGYG